jgi:cysteinyl-tRNA synthetase
MVREELGESIDIHLGGADLIFPHHENEIAQSETATGQPLARYWLHNGMVNVGGEKMSKSLGNFTTIRGLLDSGVAPMTLRLFVLQAHYRKPLDFTAAGLEAAATGWAGLGAALAVGHERALGWPPAAAGPVGGAAVEAAAPADEPPGFRERFIAALDYDLNTAAALGELFELARPLRALANRLRSGEAPGAADQELAPRWRLLVEVAGVLGLKADAPGPGASTDGGAAGGALEERLRARLLQRLEAKRARDFATADRLRQELLAEGLELFDKGAGVTTASGGPLAQPLTVALEPAAEATPPA